MQGMVSNILRKCSSSISIIPGQAGDLPHESYTGSDVVQPANGHHHGADAGYNLLLHCPCPDMWWHTHDQQYSYGESDQQQYTEQNRIVGLGSLPVCLSIFLNGLLTVIPVIIIIFALIIIIKLLQPLLYSSLSLSIPVDVL